MTRISLVIGHAGTGKTTWLIEKAKEVVQQLITKDYQSMLAITRMHGARRRIHMKLSESCPSIRFSVTTIDGFALSIVNRWRTALGYTRPIQSVDGNVNFLETIFGTEADFTRILTSATRLMQSPIVSSIIGETYPLILIDEFQDCHGPLLEFVKALSKFSVMLLAADDFQSLDTTVAECPAIEWVTTIKNKDCAEISELTECHRTSEQAILNAAKCLRDNASANGRTIPVFCSPAPGPFAWKIINSLVLHHYSDWWNGTTAVISPSHDPFLNKVLDSCTNQLKNKGRAPIRWHEEVATEVEKSSIQAALGASCISKSIEQHGPASTLDPISDCIVRRAQKFARLRGLPLSSHEVIKRHVDIVIHEKRAYGSYCPSNIVTTVHGAKNREFDNVFILWTYKIPPNKIQQRKLLYNAVTRSRRNCMLLVLGDLARAQNDDVLRLLGPAQSAIAKR